MKTLVLGGGGMLGGAFTRLLRERGWEVAAWDRTELDITDETAVKERIAAWKPELIVNCAAYNAMDKAPDEPIAAMAINGHAVSYIVQAALASGAAIVHFSTDYVFEGTNTAGYTEDAAPNPVSVYGESKVAGERALLEVVAGKPTIRWYLIRTSRLFGEPGTSEGSKKSFPAIMIDLAKVKNELQVIAGVEISSPTYVDDLARATIELIESGKPSGIYHRTNDGSCAWYEYAKVALEAARLATPIKPVGPEVFPRKAKRPAYSVLLSTKLPPLRPWQEALREFLGH